MLGKVDWNLSPRQQPVRVVQLQLLEEPESDLRRRDLRELRERHRGTLEDQRAERQPVHHADREPAERVPLHLLARESAALGRRRRTCRPTRRWDSDTTFRFGNPFFLGPNVDELMQRFQLKNNFSIVTGRHTIKAGGEWMHTNNAQVFRGFFEGRYIFDSVTGFLRYASPAARRRLRTLHRRLLERRPMSPRRRAARPGRHAHRRSAVLLPAEQQPGRRRARRGGRVRHQQRGVRAVHPGQVAAGPRPDDRLRPPLGRPAHARDRRSGDDRVRVIS